MKTFKLLLLSAMALLVASCSGGSASYSPTECEQLSEKIKAKEDLTENDYNMMIDQMVAVVKLLDEKKTEIGDDQTKKDEFVKSDEGKNLIGYAIGFAFYLEAHKKDLSESNLKKMEEAQAELKDIKL